MADNNSDHERRISTLEGERRSLATKADLADFKAEIIQYMQEYMQNALREQTNWVIKALEKQSEDIRALSEEVKNLRQQESRFKGAVDMLKYALPFPISIIAVIVALTK